MTVVLPAMVLCHHAHLLFLGKQFDLPHTLIVLRDLFKTHCFMRTNREWHNIRRQQRWGTDITVGPVGPREGGHCSLKRVSVERSSGFHLISLSLMVPLPNPTTVQNWRKPLMWSKWGGDFPSMEKRGSAWSDGAYGNHPVAFNSLDLCPERSKDICKTLLYF